MEAIILKCLKKHVEDRYPHARALKEDLLRHFPTTAPRPGNGLGSTDPRRRRGRHLAANARAVRGWSFLAGVLFALLPDIDYFLIFSDRLAFIRHHRGFTHSLTALPLFALLGALAGRALGGPRWFRPLFFLGLAVLLSHLLLDLATSYGTQILFPFTRKRFTLDWLFIIDPYLTALLLAGTAAALWSPTWGRKSGLYFLTAAGVYFLLCGFYHQQALNLAGRSSRGTRRAGRRAACCAAPP